MNLAFNPKDPNTFVSACLDRTVKMWSLGSSQPNFTMEAHDKGVNYVDFYPGADKPYLVTTGDDKSGQSVGLPQQELRADDGGPHENNVSFCRLPSELADHCQRERGRNDQDMEQWTYRVENTLSYALERSWCVALRKDANEVAVGFDEGVVVIKLGRDEPTLSMDPSGKLIYTRNHDVLSGNLQTGLDR